MCPITDKNNPWDPYDEFPNILEYKRHLNKVRSGLKLCVLNIFTYFKGRKFRGYKLSRTSTFKIKFRGD